MNNRRRQRGSWILLLAAVTTTTSRASQRVQRPPAAAKPSTTNDARGEDWWKDPLAMFDDGDEEESAALDDLLVVEEEVIVIPEEEEGPSETVEIIEEEEEDLFVPDLEDDEIPEDLDTVDSVDVPEIVEELPLVEEPVDVADDELIDTDLIIDQEPETPAVEEKPEVVKEEPAAPVEIERVAPTETETAVPEKEATKEEAKEPAQNIDDEEDLEAVLDLAENIPEVEENIPEEPPKSTGKKDHKKRASARASSKRKWPRKSLAPMESFEGDSKQNSFANKAVQLVTSILPMEGMSLIDIPEGFRASLNEYELEENKKSGLSWVFATLMTRVPIVPVAQGFTALIVGRAILKVIAKRRRGAAKEDSPNVDDEELEITEEDYDNDGVGYPIDSDHGYLSDNEEEVPETAHPTEDGSTEDVLEVFKVKRPRYAFWRRNRDTVTVGDLYNQLQTARDKCRDILNDKAAMEKLYETTSWQLKEAQSEMTALKQTTNYLQTQLRDQEELVQSIATTEQRKAKEEMERMKEAMVKVIQRERENTHVFKNLNRSFS